MRDPAATSERARVAGSVNNAAASLLVWNKRKAASPRANSEKQRSSEYGIPSKPNPSRGMLSASDPRAANDKRILAQQRSLPLNSKARNSGNRRYAENSVLIDQDGPLKFSPTPRPGSISKLAVK